MNAVNEHKKFGMAIEKWRVLMLAAFAVLAAGGFLCSVLSGAVAIPVSALGDILNGGGDNASRQILLNIRLQEHCGSACGHEPCRQRRGIAGSNEKSAGRPSYYRHFFRRGAGRHFCYSPVSGVGIFNCTDCVLRRHACRSLHLHSGVEKRHPPTAYCAGRRCRIKLSGRWYFSHTCALQRQSTRSADVDGGRPCGTFMAPC